MTRYVTAQEALGLVRSGMRVFVQTAAAAPQQLIAALVERAPDLRGVEIVHMHTEGSAAYAEPKYQDSFHASVMFVGQNLREAVNAGRADYIPVFLSEVPRLFRQKILPLDVALLHVSPPDRHGYCSLGISVDVARAASDTARILIAQVNPNMPRTHGDGLIHVSRLTAMVECNDPIMEHHPSPLTDTERAIGRHVAGLVEDGATLQMGIGAIPDAVLASLGSHRRLGIHTEMFSDGIIDLVEKGVITGEAKKIHPGEIVAGFAVGSRRLYDFMDDNPVIRMLDIAYVNDTAVIRRNPQVTAINSALEVDLTGQICADTLGAKQYSGVGGQMDFIRGAALSDHGRPIIALPSVTSRGESRIVGMLKPGAGVTTTRAHVHYVVTEFGVAMLYGRSLRQRAQALIDLAHPSHRESLSKTAHERFGLII
ncbi:MAG: acetyl-CoA hydrolase/transferase family protein [Myxococcales bacterium]|nr:acetyl-CoA hydrolase/transferase family protein [Myxococcales bacterium]